MPVPEWGITSDGTASVPEVVQPRGDEATDATLRLLVRLSLTDTGMPMVPVWDTIDDASSRVSCESSEHSSSWSSV